MRDQGLIFQGGCGACWAFSAIGTLEGAWAKHSGQLVRLSEQELVDCDKGDGGCGGGGISSALTWIHNHHASTAHLTRVRKVQSKNEADLKRAVHNRGPVSIALHVSSKFKAYKKGVFDDTSCPRKCPNHALLVTGYHYSESNDKTFWNVKNSWGKSWGMDGYINILEGNNICGMANSPIYAEI